MRLLSGFEVLGPPLSGSFCFSLGKDACGCDVGACGRAIDVALGCFRLRLAFAEGDPARVDVSRQIQQSFGQADRVGIVLGRPVFGRHGDEQALVAALDLLGEVEAGHLRR